MIIMLDIKLAINTFTNSVEPANVQTLLYSFNNLNVIIVNNVLITANLYILAIYIVGIEDALNSYRIHSAINDEACINKIS